MTAITKQNLVQPIYANYAVTCDRSVVFSTNKTDRHDITEILLKVVLNANKQTNQLCKLDIFWYFFPLRNERWPIIIYYQSTFKIMCDTSIFYEL
jgi:hypothetical protein